MSEPVLRLEQIDKAEQLLEELDLTQDYRYQDLCQRITTYRPEMYPDLVVTGEDAAHDLRLFIEDLSDSGYGAFAEYVAAPGIQSNRPLSRLVL
jgi:hypothetical protein